MQPRIPAPCHRLGHAKTVATGNARLADEPKMPNTAGTATKACDQINLDDRMVSGCVCHHGSWQSRLTMLNPMRALSTNHGARLQDCFQHPAISGIVRIPLSYACLAVIRQVNTAGDTNFNFVTVWPVSGDGCAQALKPKLHCTPGNQSRDCRVNCAKWASPKWGRCVKF